MRRVRAFVLMTLVWISGKGGFCTQQDSNKEEPLPLRPVLGGVGTALQDQAFGVLGKDREPVGGDSPVPSGDISLDGSVGQEIEALQHDLEQVTGTLASAREGFGAANSKLWQVALGLLDTQKRSSEAAEELTVKVKALDQEKNQLLQKTEQLEQANRSLTEETEALKQEKDRVSQKSESLAQEKAELAKKISLLEQDKSTLTGKVSSLEQASTELTLKTEQLSQANGELTQKSESLARDKTELAKKISLLEQDKSTLTGKVSSLEQASTELTLKTEQLSQANDELAQKSEFLEQEKNQLLQKTEQLELANHSLAEETEALKQEKDRVSQKNEALTRDKTELAKKISLLEQDKSTLTGKVSSLEQASTELTLKTEQLSQANDELTQKNEALTQEKTELAKKVSLLEQDRSTLTGKVSSLEQASTELTLKTERLSQANDELTQKVKSLTQERAELTLKTEQLEQTNRSLVKETGRLKQEKVRLTRKNEFLEGERNELGQRLEEIEKEKDDQLNKKIQELTDILESGKSFRKQVRVALKESDKELAQEKGPHEIVTKISEVCARNQSLEQELAEKSKREKEDKAALLQKDEEISRLRQQIELLKEKPEEGKKRIRALDNKSSEKDYKKSTAKMSSSLEANHKSLLGEKTKTLKAKKVFFHGFTLSAGLEHVDHSLWGVDECLGSYYLWRRDLSPYGTSTSGWQCASANVSPFKTPITKAEYDRLKKLRVRGSAVPSLARRTVRPSPQRARTTIKK